MGYEPLVLFKQSCENIIKFRITSTHCSLHLLQYTKSQFIDF